MPDYIDADLYERFGVSQYHRKGIYGQNTSIAVIGTGIIHPNLPDWKNVKIVTIADAGTQSTHESSVTSLIAAPTNNSGITGIAEKTTIYLLDVDKANGDMWETQVGDAIQYAIDLRVDVISISLGSDRFSSYIWLKIQLARTAGILIFAAAGNSGAEKLEYPASMDGVISVASCSKDRQLSNFNTRNAKVSLFAPGEDIPVSSTFNGGNGVVFESGTSFATPFAAALFLLILSGARERQGSVSFRMSAEEALATLKNAQHLNTGSLAFSSSSLSINNNNNNNNNSNDGSDGNIPVVPNSVGPSSGGGDGSGGGGVSSTALMICAIILLILAAAVVYITAKRRERQQRMQLMQQQQLMQ
jgi:hypothetical protein